MEGDAPTEKREKDACRGGEEGAGLSTEEIPGWRNLLGTN